MSIDAKRFGLVVMGVAMLGGCTFDPRTGKLVEPHPELGEASRQTFLAQVVDPDPVYPQPATSSGDQAARAINAYREGKVEQPKAPAPTVSGSGSGSSGGSGGTR